jgi:Protein of unknown function (DUF3179)
MRCRILMPATAVCSLLVIAGVVGCSAGGKEKSKGTDQTSSSLSTVDNSEPIASNDKTDSPLPKLPETSPPRGLPIVPWGKRDHFPVIRHPEYWTVKQAEGALAYDEPVLGVIIGTESRAYSTNQLNEHEMVIDTIADTPVLVTY